MFTAPLISDYQDQQKHEKAHHRDGYGQSDPVAFCITTDPHHLVDTRGKPQDNQQGQYTQQQLFPGSDWLHFLLVIRVTVMTVIGQD